MTPTVAPADLAPPPPWILSRFPGWKPEDTIGITGPNGETLWRSNPGPQSWALACPYDEVLIGGRRGGGKSAMVPPWFAMGDPSLPADDPARASFLQDPDFRGLLLREQYQDLIEMVDAMMDFFRPFGVKKMDDPAIFVFPHPWIKGRTGAKIYTNHLNNPEAFNKYRGWNITKIAIEELTTIKELRQYLRLFGSMRSAPRVRKGKMYPRLRTQMLATTNPDGPGALWVKNRFIKVLSGANALIPPNTPMRDPVTKKTRIFIPAGLKDNPYLDHDDAYKGNILISTEDDPVLRAQWMSGDWDAATGQYFGEYRPNGPIGEEEADKYPWARHLVEAHPLKPWWFRWGSGDQGYDHPSAFHKFCRNESDGRIHVYDELVLRQIGTHELGRAVARWWQLDLELLPDHQITLYFSHEAFSKEDSGPTVAEQFAQGIRDVLGPGGAIIAKYTPEERKLAQTDPKAAAVLFEQRRAEAEGQMCITVRPGYRNRVGRFGYMRELFRFRPSVYSQEPDPAHLQFIYDHKGAEAYEMEVAKYQGHKAEVLPKVQIWSICRGADRCIQSAIHDEPPNSEDVKKFDAVDGVGGDDELDSLSVGLVAYKEIETVVPRAYWVAERMTTLRMQHEADFGTPLTDPTRLMMIHNRQQSLYGQQNPKLMGGKFSMPRQSSQRHRVQ